MCSMNLIFLAQNAACVTSDRRIIKAFDKEGIGRGLSWCVFPCFTGRTEEMRDRRQSQFSVFVAAYKSSEPLKTNLS
jgi:hypothetical protein